MSSDLQQAKQVFQDHLTGKEQILWASHPKQGICLRPSDKYMIPFSLLWCATVLIWEWFTLGMGEMGTTMAWFGIPFMLVGLYLLFGRFLMDAFNRKHTFYALSSKKILVKTGKWNSATDTFPLKMIQQLSLEKNKDNSGTLRCYDTKKVLVLQMDMVPEIHAVAGLIEKTKNASHETLAAKR